MRSGEDPDILDLRNLTVSDSGWYSCLVSNSLGRVAKYAYIAVEPRVIEVKHLAADNFGAVIGGSVAVLGVLFIVMMVILVVCRRRMKPKERILMMKHCPLYQTHPANVPFDAEWELNRQE